MSKESIHLYRDDVAGQLGKKLDCNNLNKFEREALFNEAENMMHEGKKTESADVCIRCLQNLDIKNSFPSLPRCLRALANHFLEKKLYVKAIHFVQAERLYYESALIDTARLQQRLIDITTGKQSSDEYVQSPLDEIHDRNFDKLKSRVEEYDHLMEYFQERKSIGVALGYAEKSLRLNVELYGPESDKARDSVRLVEQLSGELEREKKSQLNIGDARDKSTIEAGSVQKDAKKNEQSIIFKTRQLKTNSDPSIGRVEENRRDNTNGIRILKYIILAFAEVEMLFFSGIAFGMNSLFPTLSELNYFCGPQNATKPCSQQRQYLGYLLITTIISYSLVAVPIGAFYDKFGDSKTKIIGAIIVFLGCLAFALSSVISYNLAYVGSALLGFLAQILLTSNIALSSLLPSFQNKIISIFSGSFDSSNVMMTFITLGYRGGISIAVSFSTLAIAGLLVCSTTAVLCYTLDKKIGASSDNVNIQLFENSKDKVKSISHERSERYYEEMVNSKFPTLKSVLISRHYIMQTANLTILFFRYAYFLAELNLQLIHLFPEDGTLVNNLLFSSSFILMCGVFFSPLPGIVVDAVKKLNKTAMETCPERYFYGQCLICFTPSLFFCTTMNLIMSVLILIPKSAAIYSSYVAFMLMRVTLFSTNSSYLLLAFPKKFFGKLFGIGVLISGALSFIQYVLLYEDSRRLEIVNYSLIVIVLLTYVHPILLLLDK